MRQRPALNVRQRVEQATSPAQCDLGLPPVAVRAQALISLNTQRQRRLAELEGPPTLSAAGDVGRRTLRPTLAKGVSAPGE
jgi:hypothetical protein